MRSLSYLLIFLILVPPFLYAQTEVVPETSTRVIVREHPRTGKPFVSIVSTSENRDPFLDQRKLMKRPDYRMLDPKIKSGEIPYDGPVSDRKKVYILAASLATIGVAGGTAMMAVAPVTAGTGTAGGAGIYAGAGTGIAAGTLSGFFAVSKSDPDRINFAHVSESHAVKTETSKK